MNTVGEYFLNTNYFFLRRVEVMIAATKAITNHYPE
ncbi:hypothetical protein J2W57_002356 [Chryseobacterium ginsenosidimutans]|uniref:Uncharacterized protein n=1 Tax=Chryseobacterium geocarposphaerae TaxID=1416776 RepID=A0ABU1LGM3_9FLAO|nr:hypothetical protein [Chryseobacterium geocarposphaerae]MDR6698979.1 hypothetical protein [Chryseobacterium ginsenosidimutans]